MEEDKSADELVKEVDTEKSIDNDPDKIDFSKFGNKIKKNPWILVSIVLGIAVIVLLYMNFRGEITGNVISESDAGDKFLDYANSRGANAELVKINDKGSLYEIVLSIRGQEAPFYVTKDGKYYIPPTGLIPLTGNVVQQPSQNQQPQEIPKSDKPKVELFVMSFCPYGTQAEKGILPVVKLLGDKIDFKLRAVHYVLHGDKEDLENKRQLCIREEQGQDKLNKYLSCILDSDNPQAPADVSACEKQTGVNSAKLQTCLDTKADDYFAADSKLSEGYGVRGSPTLVINRQIVNSGRSPAAYLETICSAFTDAPEECNEDLNSQSPSPGFGYTASAGGSTDAQC